MSDEIVPYVRIDDLRLPYGKATDEDADAAALLLREVARSVQQGNVVDVRNMSLEDITKHQMIAQMQHLQGVAPDGSPEQFLRWAKFLTEHAPSLVSLSTRARAELAEAVRLYESQTLTADNRTRAEVEQATTAKLQAEDERRNAEHTNLLSERHRRRERRRPYIRRIVFWYIAVTASCWLIVTYGPQDNSLRDALSPMASLWSWTIGSLIDAIAGFVRDLFA